MDNKALSLAVENKYKQMDKEIQVRFEVNLADKTKLHKLLVQ